MIVTTNMHRRIGGRVALARLRRRGGWLLALLLAACSESSPTGPDPELELWPRTVGDEWVYRLTYVDETGTELGVARTDTIRVVRDTVDNGLTWSVMDGNPLLVAGTATGSHYLGNHTDGVWFATNLSRDPIFNTGPGGLTFKYPASPRDRYLLTYEDAVMRVESVSARAAVPAGTFQCVRYTSDLGTSHWLAPGVGIVRAESAPTREYDAGGNLIHTYRSIAVLVSAPSR
jgi:hypothetical protein